ncbi:unnamed protein product [Ophioblennius macclurei]
MSVLIGLCDGHLDPKRHRSSFLTNKAGGLPDWLPAVSGRFPRCRRCGAASALVVQIYCPVDLTPTHRNLHLFACTRPACSGISESWTVLRSECAVENRDRVPESDPDPEPELRVTDWCDNADDWGMEEVEVMKEATGVVKGCHQEEDTVAVQEKQAESPAGGEMDISGHLQDLQLGDPSPEEAAVFNPLFISVVDEADLYVEDDDDESEHIRKLLREYESREGAVVEEELEGGGGGGTQEKYEKSKAKHGDQVFSGFMKLISRCPQQILRYSYSGRPLFVTSPPPNLSQLTSSCSSCGAARTFELQLMPALVSLLRRMDCSSDSELEFGTVIVYTCSKSCWTPGSNSAVEEFCLVQTDPDQKLFK